MEWPLFAYKSQLNGNDYYSKFNVYLEPCSKVQSHSWTGYDNYSLQSHSWNGYDNYSLQMAITIIRFKVTLDIMDMTINYSLQSHSCNGNDYYSLQMAMTINIRFKVAVHLMAMTIIRFKWLWLLFASKSLLFASNGYDY